MILSIENLSFRYPSRPVLNGIRFAIQPGECLAVLGINGAGKSTLLKCINRILKPEKGAVYIEKTDSKKLSRGELAKKIGYVSQANRPARQTVFDTIMLGRKPYIKWDITEKDLEIVQKIIEMLDLQEYSLRYIDELSGGELQKVRIARALAQEPKVLLLDEPTSNLDLKNQLEVVRLIRKVVKKKKMAAVVTMHDLNLALRFADKFLFMKDGKIYAIGGMEVMTPKNIETVYSVSVKVETYDQLPVVIPV